jgi:hypothetical protein
MTKDFGTPRVSHVEVATVSLIGTAIERYDLFFTVPPQR